MPDSLDAFVIDGSVAPLQVRTLFKMVITVYAFIHCEMQSVLLYFRRLTL
jgi:hypothetical protein